MQDAPIELGRYDPAEADQLGVIFFDAVREGATGLYDAEQREAWAPVPLSGPSWEACLLAQRTLVARSAGRPVGFMTLADDGYIDLAFVAPSHQRQGIGGRLYARIEALACEARIGRLHSWASHPMRGLFEQHGWSVVREHRIERAGVTLTNFMMEKSLVDLDRL